MNHESVPGIHPTVDTDCSKENNGDAIHLEQDTSFHENIQTSPIWNENMFFGQVCASCTHEMQNVLAIIRESSGLLEDLFALLGQKTGLTWKSSTGVYRAFKIRSAGVWN